MQQIDWNQIYQKESGKMVGVAFRYLKDRKLAEDLVQDAFIVSIQKTEHFKGKGAIEAWLRRIVVNECLMYLRKAKLKTETLTEQLENSKTSKGNDILEEHDDIWEEDVSKRKVIERANFSKEDLLDAANMLPEHHRLVFNLYVVDNFSHKEIAQYLNISEGTSKSHLNRGRKKLQDLLYQKALDMQKKKKKRFFIITWFLAVFGRVSTIDAMYKKAFLDFQLPAPPIPPGLGEALSAAPAVTVGASTAGIVTTVTCTAVVTGGVIGTVALTNQNSDDHIPEPAEIIYEEPAPDESLLEDPELFMQTEPEAEPPVVKKEPIPTIKEEDQDTTVPVVTIHIPVYDTVYED